METNKLEQMANIVEAFANINVYPSPLVPIAVAIIIKSFAVFRKTRLCLVST